MNTYKKSLKMPMG